MMWSDNLWRYLFWLEAISNVENDCVEIVMYLLQVQDANSVRDVISVTALMNARNHFNLAYTTTNI